MELIIGREASTPQGIGGRLHVVTSTKKEYFVGMEGSVPKTVSRQHCKIVINPDSSMVLSNIKATNITFINGLEIIQRAITGNEKIELGSGRYLLDLKAVLDCITPDIPQTYDISHLKAVWQRYDKAKEELQVEREKTSNIQSITGLLSMFSMGCTIIPIGIPPLVKVILYASAIILAVFFFVYRSRHVGDYVRKLKELDEQFHKEYVCPNPNCKRFLGALPYDDLIKQTKSCYVCKSNYEVKE